ncbi:MAG: DUF4159 domain-containing protein [Planctomycetota bacterium]|nr:DUF4159 domain-containing protein [Planctomycetota bacterium]
MITKSTAVFLLVIGIAAGQEQQEQKQQKQVEQQRNQVGQQINQIGQQIPRNLIQNQQFNRRGSRQVNVTGTAVIHEPFAEPMTAKKIQIAIEDALLFLRSQQRSDGSIGMQHRAGGTALAALAMLAAGANPASDDSLRNALNWLAKQEIDHTYFRGIRANTWEYALRKVPYDERIRTALKKDYEWLMKALGKRRAWRYSMASTDWDNSCSQYGVLGIWAASRAGMNPGDSFWKRMSSHFRKCQNKDGGWSYTTGRSTPNMATAGLASMFLVFDMFHGKSFYTSKNPRTFTRGDAAKVLDSISRGMDWLGKSKANRDDAYYLYGIERTGVASGRKYIGGEDWFKRGALAVLKRQGPGGEIRMGNWGGASVQTSFCTLFLIYGGAPVAFNKLEYGKGQDWNLNPRDLANLTKHLWSAYERPLNWHSVSIKADASEFEAPILFISGSQPAAIAGEDIAKLRDYVDGGGTIFAEPSDHSEEFHESMVALLRKMYPEKDYPSYKLENIPADHGVYTVLRQSWEKRPELLGASDGSRTFFFLSKEYMSADWQMNRTETDAFKLAMNMLFYVTDLGTMNGKFASILPDKPPAKERKTSVAVARIKHGGAVGYPEDWRAGHVSWKRFDPYLHHIAGRKLEQVPDVNLAKGPTNAALLHLTGRHKLNLSAEERAGLKRYVEGGGTLLVDAYAGSSPFAESARKEIETIFGPLRPLEEAGILASGRFDGGEDLTRKIRFKPPARRTLRGRGVKPDSQLLEAVIIKKRPAVIFSEFDLTGAIAGIENYRSAGYKSASARKIVGNILAYLSAD